MKRSAADAFGAAGAAPAPATFAPTGAAMMDPKAYFAQWQKAAATGAQVPFAAAMGATPVAAPAPVAAAASPEEKTEIHKQVEAASAVRCAAIVKEKGQNFTPVVAIEALCTMATKSSFKLREDLLKQPPVRNLCKRVQEILKKPQGVDLLTISRAAEALTKFPDEASPEKAAGLGSIAKSLSSLTSSEWSADTAARILWSLAKCGKGEAIQQNKHIVSHVVKELVRDKGRRVNELSHEGLMRMLWAIAKARMHNRQGDMQTVHTEENDSIIFQYASKRVIDEVEEIPVSLLAELVYTHHEIGIRDEKLFRAMCPQIVEKQKELREDQMAKCIKAYTRFMIPLKEKAQGFRTMAVVQKGDFIRPSDKPKTMGKKTYEKPQALYPSTQLHAK
eukprot:TRINITY_DN81306_c0_g1_i1.p1 TRINITY_DN81306_c0_g1~~TRINITY_DN81306_c0_g1_i1.p1  ORF type:complete len:391 (+),score=108.49 TRINITY_DN81306_c0_g1_i1:19-1191(+)